MLQSFFLATNLWIKELFETKSVLGHTQTFFSFKSEQARIIWRAKDEMKHDYTTFRRLAVYLSETVRKTRCRLNK